MLDYLGDELVDYFAVIFVKIETSLTWLLTTSSREDDEIGAAKVSVVVGGNDLSVLVKRGSMNEVIHFTLGFFEIATDEN
mgnify:CR=1 FL=1